ncbi:N-fatty-acyl-amino acid synthase/hydrolase PM20D1 isoform X2 [Octopus bimaculoides]|uniref:Peptidase M20 dimerisation domain-containing protein n=1 Tax=Octopus bimaculoides TaxID=37653 RepID=A0A0L8G6E2_OCTBM|nr:N-fatty-acyl-amino acid synthase/hydrolase PM20D1 isoform X2 [Octopus bimaculoides]|eukprot:XP_014783797.1 PREDICTED: probable carboxypeptidase PM20D1 isoform X2 [Octopus bimaculoides]
MILHKQMNRTCCFAFRKCIKRDNRHCEDLIRKREEHSKIDVGTNPQIVENFRQALRFKTIAWSPGVYETEELTKLRLFIEQTYPTIHKSPLVKYEVVANYSLLYTVEGSDKNLSPYLLAAHLDVVPVTEENWKFDPFGAEHYEGYIYGRGAIDVKLGVMGILEALEHALKTGFKPKRSFFVAFGHDEEVFGEDGARHIGQLLERRGVQLEYLFDEGLMIIKNFLKGLQPVAMIGVVEKGQAMVKLSVNGTAGHSSAPPAESVIGILSAAICNIEANPQPDMFGTGAERASFEHLAPKLPLIPRILLSNLWLFRPAVSWFLSRKSSTNAFVRTVSAVTKFNAGIKENVLPASAEAIVNHRIHPSQTVEQVVEYDRKIINDDRVKITLKGSLEPSATSPYDDNSFGYHTLKNSIREIYTDVIVVPGLMFANTDTRHYKHLTKSIYRFNPAFVTPETASMVHGDNEKISVSNYEKAINFYYHVILNSNHDKLGSKKHTEL